MADLIAALEQRYMDEPSARVGVIPALLRTGQPRASPGRSGSTIRPDEEEPDKEPGTSCLLGSPKGPCHLSANGV
jgi:hypothetical protein